MEEQVENGEAVLGEETSRLRERRGLPRECDAWRNRWWDGTVDALSDLGVGEESVALAIKCALIFAEGDVD